jgi:hypothetical protein
MRITEFDIAMLIIAIFGMIGIVCEPWSPHPPLMVGVGSLYLVVRCALFATAIMKDYLRIKNRKRRTKLCGRR